MAETLEKQSVLKGGEFVIRDSKPAETFIPEELNEDQQMIKNMVAEFVAKEIDPNQDKIEKQENNIAADLLRKAGELGLLGAHIPEEYGGMPMDTNTGTVIAEEIGRSGSFSVSYAAHTGIGMLPILYYGTEEQKKKYLPGLSTGELVASYCLTEPGSGSDALAAKTKAIPTEDGEHYHITGQKMWITNAGFANLFIVFAQIDGDKFTAFIIERDAEGLTLGAEEDKMGIKGSSTRQVFFENVKVSKDNILGEIGKGHHIAFNVLNIGRFKLGVLTMGAAKRNASLAVRYANEREQFKVPISSFGAMKHKIAEQAIQIYTCESALYRVSHLLQHHATELFESGTGYAEAKQKAAEEYAVECALLKVLGSEVLDYVADETVQIHGGNGFSEEYTAARDYRDSRINRIFEGTNEINRLLMVGMLLKRAMRGNLDLVGPAWAVQKELSGMPKKESVEGPFSEEQLALKQLKKVLLIVAGAAAKQQMDGNLNLETEQEIVMNIADIMIDLFTFESTLLRVQKLEAQGKASELHGHILQVFCHDVVHRIDKNAKDALMSFAAGDELRIMLMGVKRYTKYMNVNVKNARRAIAAHQIEANEYAL